MAILSEFRGLGLGNGILKYGESILKHKNIKVVWCNARANAMNFYKKNNYKLIGKPFNVEGIGAHVIMHKYL